MTKNIMRFLFLFFILFSVNKLKADAIDDNIMKGLELLYNVNFDEAKSYFDKSISIDPTDPRGYLCLLYTSPSPRDRTRSRMPSSA